MGRRWGKSALSQILILETAGAGKPVGLFCPTYKYLDPSWLEMVTRFRPFTADLNRQKYRLTLTTGGVIEGWSLEDGDAGRGRRYARVVIDEAGMVSDLGHTWTHAIRPTLADYQGDAYFLGTPKGRNFFWQAYTRGQDAMDTEWRSWQMPTSANPHIPAAEIEAMRATMPERVYRQEILAEFLDDAGGVFRGVRESATAAPQAQATPGHGYVIGCDWGRQADATVYAVMDTTTRELCHLDRMTRTEYALQRSRLRALWERFNRPIILAEENSMGGPVVEELVREGLPVSPFATTSTSKSQIIDALTLAFERRELRIIADEVLIAELEAYEATRLPSGAMRYGAPEGMHDDTVIATALAWWAGASRQGWRTMRLR